MTALGAFRYRAATGSGDVVEGVVNASTAQEAGEALRRQALVPVSVEAVITAPARSTRIARQEAIAAAMRTLSLLVGAGVTLERAIDFVERHAGHPGVAAAFREVREEVQRGVTLSDAARRQPLLGVFTAAMIHAGEESGTLDQALARLADWFERAGGLRSQVRAALLYPALMGIVAGLGVFVLLAVVVPRFVSILGDVGGTLPLSTRLLVGASRLVVGGWWLWLPLALGAVLGARWWLGDDVNRRRWHAFRLRLPVVGDLEQAVGTARFTSALGVLLEGGTPTLAALGIAREGVSNRSMAAELESAVQDVARGERVAESLRGALPLLAVELLAAGEESGRLAEVCQRVARAHEAQVERSLGTIVRLVEPALILLFGVVIGFIALAMLQAVYSVNAGFA